MPMHMIMNDTYPMYSPIIVDKSGTEDRQENLPGAVVPGAVPVFWPGVVSTSARPRRLADISCP